MTSPSDDNGWVDSLAGSVIEQAQAFVPADVRLAREGTGSSLWIRALAAGAPMGDARFAFGKLACGVEDRLEGAEIAVAAFLSGLQDWIARNTATPWPGRETVMPALHVRTDESRIDAWFGAEDSPERVSAAVH